MQPDVIVVGAGPGGCAVSALLGRAGHRVLLLDRAGVPHPRLCTHAIMPSALPVLDQLGVLPAILSAGACRWWGVRLSIEGVRIQAPLPRRGAAAPYGLSLRRELLDPILLDAARCSGNVDVRLGWTALAPLIGDGAVHGIRARAPDGRTHAIAARLVVAADGRRSSLLAAAGCRPYALPNRHTAWIAYLAGLPLEDRPHLEAFYRAGRSVSLLPADAGLRVAGVTVPHNHWSRREAPERMLAAMRSFPELRSRVANARLVSPAVNVRGLRNTIRPAPPPGITPLGDAAVQSDPAFGQGIAWALRGAHRLARAIDVALATPGDAPLAIPAATTRDPLSVPLLLGMSLFSAIPPGSLIERIAIHTAAAAPRLSTLALRLATGFATAAPAGARRTPNTFLREVLATRPHPPAPSPNAGRGGAYIGRDAHCLGAGWKPRA